jgi:hypothetical protein
MRLDVQYDRGALDEFTIASHLLEPAWRHEVARRVRYQGATMILLLCVGAAWAREPAFLIAALLYLFLHWRLARRGWRTMALRDMHARVAQQSWSLPVPAWLEATVEDLAGGFGRHSWRVPWSDVLSVRHGGRALVLRFRHGRPILLFVPQSSQAALEAFVQDILPRVRQHGASVEAIDPRLAVP